MTKLFITDAGDPTVGVFACTFEVTCPVEAHDGKEEIEFFRNAQIECFENYAFGKVTAEYDFERAAIAEAEKRSAFIEAKNSSYNA